MKDLKTELVTPIGHQLTRYIIEDNAIYDIIQTDVDSEEVVHQCDVYEVFETDYGIKRIQIMKNVDFYKALKMCEIDYVVNYGGKE